MLYFINLFYHIFIITWKNDHIIITLLFNSFYGEVALRQFSRDIYKYVAIAILCYIILFYYFIVLFCYFNF